MQLCIFTIPLFISLEQTYSVSMQSTAFLKSHRELSVALRVQSWIPIVTTIPDPQHGSGAMYGSGDTETSERKAASSVGWRAEELVIMQNLNVSLLLFISGSFMFATHLFIFLSFLWILWALWICFRIHLSASHNKQKLFALRRRDELKL